MRHQGRVTTWRDERGFGFITPDPRQTAGREAAAGTDVFLHVSAVVDRSRPQLHDRVSYTLGRDQKGRPRATAVKRIGARSTKPAIPVVARWVAALLGLVVLLVAAVRFADPGPAWVVTSLYGVASAVTFLAYALDKSAARNGLRRTPERTLHLLALVGGWPGALAAQRLLRHKSSKRSFQAVFRITVVLNAALLVGMLTPGGQDLLETLWSTLG